MKIILIIGGAGYVGTVMTSHFLRKGYKVAVLDNFIYGNYRSVEPFLGDSNYTLIKGDMTLTSDLDKISDEVTDVVLLAGLVGDPITKQYPNESKTINEDGVKNCMTYFNNRGIDKFVFVSTCSNYGLIKENELADENFELNPLSLYANAKVGAEKFLMGQKNKVDYTGVVLRFATAFGLSSRMRFDLSVSEFVRDIHAGEELLVFDEHTWRPYCHVRDFARLIDIVLNAPKDKVNFEVFNAGGDVNNFTKKMIVDQILDQIPNGKVTFGKQGNDPRNYRVSFKKVKTQLGFEPEYSVTDGITELVEALNDGFYSNSIENKVDYGNFELKI